MAKVLNPMMSGRAIGSVGGLTATQWKGTDVLRLKQRPAKRLRPIQTTNRARLGFLSRWWGAQLSEAERESWRDWAASHPQPNGFGGTFIMSGEQAFIKLNQVAMRSQSLTTPIESAPIADLDKGIATLTLVTPAVNGKIEVDWTLNGTGVVGDKIEQSLAGPFTSPGRIEVDGKFHWIGWTAGNVVTGDILNLEAGAWYFTRVRYVQADGQVSAWVQGQAQAGTAP